MATQGVGTFKLNSFWESGRLIFYEKASGHTTTGDVFILGHDYVQVGDTANDVDFKWYGDTTGTFILDAGAHTLTMTGVDVSITGDLTIVTEDINLPDDSDLEFGSSQDVVMRWSTGDASNHAFVLGLDDTAQQMHITDKGAVATDWNRSAGTHPELSIHSNTTPATDYLAIGNHDGTTAYIDVVGGTTLQFNIAGTGEVSLTANALSPVTSDNNALGTTSLMWSDLFLASAAVINFNNGDVTLTHGSNALTLAGGQLNMAGGVSIVGIKLGTLSSTTPGSGLTVDATTTRGMEVHVDDNDTARAVGTQGRAIFGRTMIYADNACEDWGIHGLSKISGVAKTGNVSAGVVGAFESTGTCSTATGSGNTFVAGVMGRIGGGGTFTIGAGTYVVGVLSFYNTPTASNFTNTGTCAFMATASDIAATGNWDYGLYIEDTVYGIYVNAEPTATGRIAKFAGSIAAPNLGDGYGAFEVDATFSGTVAGTSAAFSSWVNIAAAGVPGGNIICAQNNGIYLPTGITASSAKMIMGMRMQYVADDGANPGSLYCFSTNIYSNQITAIFDVNAAVDFRWVSGALTNGACNIPLFRDASAGVTYYVNCYTS